MTLIGKEYFDKRNRPRLKDMSTRRFNELDYKIQRLLHMKDMLEDNLRLYRFDKESEKLLADVYLNLMKYFV